MPNLSIKDVPESLAEALRQRASRHHRSLQGELMAIIEEAAHGDAPAGASGEQAPTPSRASIVGYDTRGWPVIRRGWKTPEQIGAELRARFPDAPASGVSSIELIRQDRDGR